MKTILSMTSQYGFLSKTQFVRHLQTRGASLGKLKNCLLRCQKFEQITSCHVSLRRHSWMADSEEWLESASEPIISLF